MEHRVDVRIVIGPDPPEYYVRCEDHLWSSPDTTSDSDEADRWMQEHLEAHPLPATA